MDGLDEIHHVKAFKNDYDFYVNFDKDNYLYLNGERYDQFYLLLNTDGTSQNTCIYKTDCKKL